MANKILQNAAVVLTFSLCLTLLLGISNAQVTSTDTPSGDDAFVELAPGVAGEITLDGAGLLLDPRECWEAIGKVTTCILDILQNLGKGKMNFISPKCCEGFGGISGQCWTNVLPFDDFTTGFIKNVCSRISAVPPAKFD